MERINKYRSFILLGLAGLFLIWIIFYMLAIRPVNANLKEQKLTISQLEQEKDILENKVNELMSSAGDITPAEAAAQKAIPQGDDTETLIKQLKIMGLSSHARLKDISFVQQDLSTSASLPGLTGQSTTGLKEIKMSAIVEGGYADIYAWLKLLNEQERVLSIDTFAFQQPYQFPTPQQPGSILTANVSFTAYYVDIAATK